MGLRGPAWTCAQKGTENGLSVAGRRRLTVVSVVVGGGKGNQRFHGQQLAARRQRASSKRERTEESQIDASSSFGCLADVPDPSRSYSGLSVNQPNITVLYYATDDTLRYTALYKHLIAMSVLLLHTL